MTVTIELPPDIGASLDAQARAQGLGLPEYLAHLLSDRVPPRDKSDLSPGGRAAAWRESVKGLPRTAPLSD